MLESYYKILGLSLDADEKSLKKAYHKLALKIHPDVNPDTDAVKKFQELCEAYEIILSRINSNTQIFVSQPEEEGDDLVDYEEIIKKARERATARARMRYEKVKAEKEFFESHPLFVVLRYIGNYLAIPLSFGLIFFPIIAAFQEGIHMFFGLFFFWIIGGVLIMHINSKKETWFHPGKINITWHEIISFFHIEKREVAKEACFFSKNRMANSTAFHYTLFQVRDIQLKNYGAAMHSVGYKRKYKEVIIPRSYKAYLLHFILSIIKPIIFVLGLIFFPIPSFIWRIAFSFCLVLIIENLILFIGRTKSKTRFLLTPFVLIKISLWIIIILSQTTLYSGLVLFSTNILFAIVLLMLFFLDLVLDLTLRIFPFYKKMYRPLLKQPGKIENLFEEGYQNYLDIPIWTTIYPFFRYLF